MINISDMYFMETKDKILMDISACTVSPWQEVAWLVTEGGLSIKLTGRGFYGENVFQITSQGDLSVKPIITLSMFTYKQWQ